MIYYTLKVDIMHVRWDPLDRFFNLVKVDNFCTVEHHTLTHVNCWQKIPSYALEWSHFCIEKIFCPFFRIPCEAEEVAEKTDSCHASSKTQIERKRRVDEKREREMLYFHSRCKLENYSKLSTRKLKNPCVWWYWRLLNKHIEKYTFRSKHLTD